MTHNAVGVTTLDSPLLRADWHKNLTPKQLAAYIRYQFIWLKDNAVDWDSRAHSVRRPKWDGGTDLSGVKHSSTWGEIALRVADSNAEPGMWVHAHFSPVAEKRDATISALSEVLPNKLHSKMSANIYGKYVLSIQDIIWRNFELAGRTLNQRFLTTRSLGFSEDEQKLYVLCDESYVTAPPFFRHAFAAIGPNKCYPAIEEYLWLAALDYEVHQTAYDNLITMHNEQWWITDELKAAVIEIRGHWENYHG
jgi:hypothetical protein